MGVGHMAVADDLRRDVLHEVARDGEPDAGRRRPTELGIGRRERRNPDHPALEIGERAAGIARVDRGARLDHERQRDAVASETPCRKALTIPSVTLDRSPNGLPIAIATFPTSSWL